MRTLAIAAPAPGSPAARRHGCICPVKENHAGLGRQLEDRVIDGEPWSGLIAYLINPLCPLHKTRTPNEENPC